VIKYGKAIKKIMILYLPYVKAIAAFWRRNYTTPGGKALTLRTAKLSLKSQII